MWEILTNNMNNLKEQHLQFKDEIMANATQVFREVEDNSNVVRYRTFIGVHARRGDYIAFR